MNFIDFKSQLNNGTEGNIYLFEGEDAFFIKRGVSLLKNKYISEPQLNYAELDGETASLSDIMTSLNTFPFMDGKRLTVVKEFYPDRKTFPKALSEYFDAPNAESLFAICNGKPCDWLKKYPSVIFVDCNKQDAGVLVKWIKAECSKNNCVIDGETATLIANYCLNDMTRIETETKKLCDYAFGKEITREIVNELVSKDSEYKIYEMTDCVGRKRYGEAIAIVNEMLEKGETAQRIIFSLYNYYRRLLHVAISDKDNAELSALLGVHEYAVKKTREQAKLFKKKSLKKVVDFLTDLDYKTKCGLTDVDEGMWLVIFKIMMGE